MHNPLDLPVMPRMLKNVRSMNLLGTVSIVTLMCATAPALAANFIVSNHTELVEAIRQANLNGHESSTITLSENVTLAGPVPEVTKSLIIDAGSFTLSTGSTTFDTAEGATLTVKGLSTTGNMLKEGDGTVILSGFDGSHGRTLEVTSGTLQIEGGSQISAGGNTSASPVRVKDGTLLVRGAGTTVTVVPGGAASNVGSITGARLIIAEGAHLVTSDKGMLLANTAGESGSLTVTGTGSLFDGRVLGSSKGQVDIEVSAGGTILTTSAGIGGIASSAWFNGGTGSVVVKNRGTSWTNTGAFHLFNGTMDILAGSNVTSETAHIAAARLTGGATTSTMTAHVRVDGIGSQLSTTSTAANAFQVGGGGGAEARSATLSISNGGVVNVAGGDGTIELAQTAIAEGTLNIGGLEGEAATGAGTLRASLIQFGAGSGTINFNHTDDAYQFDTTLASGAGSSVINHVGSGKTIFADQSAFTGETNVRAGILEVNGSLGGNMNVWGGRLQGIGQVGTTSNYEGGTITPGTSIGTLTVNGDYTSNGGALEIEAVLGGDDSSSDLLVITGNSVLGSGATQVGVINLGGAGAPTVEGIKIIDVAGVSDADAFSLIGDYVLEGEQAVIGGAYAYRLYHNGVSDPADGNWYLRSELVPATPPSSPTPVPPVTPPLETPTPVPPVTPPLVSTPPAQPLYQPGVPVYESYANILQTLNTVGTLQQRVGNRTWLNLGSDDKTKAAENSIERDGAWIRIEAAHGDYKPKKSTVALNMMSIF